MSQRINSLYRKSEIYLQIITRVNCDIVTMEDFPITEVRFYTTNPRDYVTLYKDDFRIEEYRGVECLVVPEGFLSALLPGTLYCVVSYADGGIANTIKIGYIK